MRAVYLSLALLGLLALAVAGCSPSAPAKSAAAERVVNVYNWDDYIKPEVLRQFQAQTVTRFAAGYPLP